MLGGPTTLDDHVGGFIYSWSVHARTMSLTEHVFNANLNSAAAPCHCCPLPPWTTTSTHPHHSCTVVRPSFPVHAPSPRLYCGEAFLPRPLRPFRSLYPCASSPCSPNTDDRPHPRPTAHRPPRVAPSPVPVSSCHPTRPLPPRTHTDEPPTAPMHPCDGVSTRHGPLPTRPDPFRRTPPFLPSSGICSPHLRPRVPH